MDDPEDEYDSTEEDYYDDDASLPDYDNIQPYVTPKLAITSLTAASPRDADFINAPPDNATNHTIPNDSNFEPNLDRPVFSSSTPKYHNPRHLGTLPFYYPESI